MKASARVNRVMTASVVSIEIDASVDQVLHIFVAYPIHHLPVVKQGRVVGMLSSADIMKLEFFLPPTGPTRDRLLRGNFSIAKLMRTPVIVTHENDSIEHAAELMAKNAIHSLPVVNQRDQLVGIITTTDIIAGFLGSTDQTAGPDPQPNGHERLAALEHLAHEARRYLHAGQDERVHASLAKAIERLDRIEEQMQRQQTPVLGLDSL